MEIGFVYPEKMCMNCLHYGIDKKIPWSGEAICRLHSGNGYRVLTVGYGNCKNWEKSK